MRTTLSAMSMKKQVETRPGSPDCPKCHGDGFLRGDTGGPHPPSYDMCSCVLLRELRTNMERAMPGLSHSPVVESSPLLDRERDNLFITANDEWFRAHLRHVVVRNPPTWFARVCSDADLVTAWLATVSLQGNQILDPDANAVSLTHATIADLVTPPDLLIVRMGIKAARNAACSEVLVEAINLRDHAGKPTWVWDTPTQRLVPGHLFHSEAVDGVLRRWERVTESTGSRARSAPKPTGVKPSTPEASPGEVLSAGGRVVLSDMGVARRSLRKEKT